MYYFDKFKYVTQLPRHSNLQQMLSSWSVHRHCCCAVVVPSQACCYAQCIQHVLQLHCSLITGNMKITNVHTARTIMHCLHSTKSKTQHSQIQTYTHTHTQDIANSNTLACISFISQSASQPANGEGARPNGNGNTLVGCGIFVDEAVFSLGAF